MQVILIVGTKLQVIITKLGLRIQEKGDVVRGAPVVQPGDDLFWFGRPRFILFLIHLVLFTVQYYILHRSVIHFRFFSPNGRINSWVRKFLHFAECISTCLLCLEYGKQAISFSLQTLLFWGHTNCYFWYVQYEFNLKNCFHESNADVLIRIVIG